MSSQIARSANRTFSSPQSRQKWGFVEYSIVFSAVTLSVIIVATVLLTTFRMPLVIAGICASTDKTLCAAIQTISQNDALVLDTGNRTIWCDEDAAGVRTFYKNNLTIKRACRAINEWSRANVELRNAAK